MSWARGLVQVSGMALVLDGVACQLVRDSHRAGEQQDRIYVVHKGQLPCLGAIVHDMVMLGFACDWGMYRKYSMSTCLDFSHACSLQARMD